MPILCETIFNNDIEVMYIVYNNKAEMHKMHDAYSICICNASEDLICIYFLQVLNEFCSSKTLLLNF